jgi:hypothetical protein
LAAVPDLPIRVLDRDPGASSRIGLRALAIATGLCSQHGQAGGCGAGSPGVIDFVDLSLADVPQIHVGLSLDDTHCIDNADRAVVGTRFIAVSFSMCGTRLRGNVSR